MLIINAPRSAVIVGNILLWGGVIPLVLWVLDYINVIRPNSDPGEWELLLFCAGLISLGSLLIAGKGDTVAEVFINLKNKITKS